MRASGQIVRLAASAVVAVTLVGQNAQGQANPPTTAQPGGNCTAEVNAEFRKDEIHDAYVDKVFGVRTSSPEQCAIVTYDLATTERLFNGEIVKSTLRSDMKTTSSGGTAQRFVFRVERDTELISWNFKVVRCMKCGTE